MHTSHYSAPNTDAIVTSITHEVLFLDGEITCEIQFDVRTLITAIAVTYPNLCMDKNISRG